jgi:three-Cys-motif partner protein
MAEDSTRYVTGTDGLAAREVGPWVEQKVHYVDRYAEIFATGMKNRWPRRAYLELFAGPGQSFDRRHQSFITGSALRAIEKVFTDFVFVDIDPRATTALTHRLAAIPHPGKQVHVFEGNCNDAHPAFRDVVPATALTLAFIDPTTWQVTFDAIRQLADGRPVDLLFTFHIATMRRMVKLDAPALTAFFGTSDWKAALRLPKADRTLALLELYNDRLGTIGYLPGSSRLAVPVTNSRGVKIYYLVLFSKNPRGLDFWEKAIENEWSGQLRLSLL